MNAISCPFSSRRCKTSASSLKQPSAFNPSGTSFWTSLQCVSAKRTTHFVYATCYLCLGHVCYLCLGHGPEPRPTKVWRVSSWLLDSSSWLLTDYCPRSQLLVAETGNQMIVYH